MQAFAAEGEKAHAHTGRRLHAASTTRPRAAARAAAATVTGSYIFGPAGSGNFGNYFDATQMTPGGQPSVPASYGNALPRGYQNVPVDYPSTWTEFGWSLVNPTGTEYFIAEVDITKAPSGWLITWTESFATPLASGWNRRPVTVKLISDAFAACTSITLASNTFPSPGVTVGTTQSLALDTVTLTTPDYEKQAPQTFKATWTVRCPVSTPLRSSR